MFTQKISMDCTKEQYEKYLKDELLKMGYNNISVTFWENETIIVNNADNKTGFVGTFTILGKEMFERHYLGSFNAPLFLALAAMTDKAEGNYGEYVVGLRTGRFYRMKGDERILPEHILIRKATKEEIMAKFGENKTENGKEIAEKLCLEAISFLKSKGYKILKPKTWEEI